jgi:hypothetical protein
MPQKPNRKRRPSGAGAGPRAAAATIGGVTLSHPDRIYWRDSGVSKRDLADFYSQIWQWMRPHVVSRPQNLRVFLEELLFRNRVVANSKAQKSIFERYPAALPYA